MGLGSVAVGKGHRPFGGLSRARELACFSVGGGQRGQTDGCWPAVNCAVRSATATASVPLHSEASGHVARTHASWLSTSG